MPMPTPVEVIQRLGRTCRGVIHVGANGGHEIPSYQAGGILWAIMIEPGTGPFGRLQQAIKGIPNYLALQVLCAAREGVEHDFYLANNGGQSSSILRPTGHLTMAPVVKFTETIKLRSTTVDQIMMQLVDSVAGFSTDAIDLLCIDVQGAELEVLKGATQTLQTVKYVFCEVSYGTMYEGGACIEDLVTFLRCFGFRLNWADINRWNWGDALFVRP